jgi:hypothetical protein
MWVGESFKRREIRVDGGVRHGAGTGCGELRPDVRSDFLDSFINDLRGRHVRRAPRHRGCKNWFTNVDAKMYVYYS